MGTIIIRFLGILIISFCLVIKGALAQGLESILTNPLNIYKKQNDYEWQIQAKKQFSTKSLNYSQQNLSKNASQEIQIPEVTPKLSPIEEDFIERTKVYNEILSQFGYDFFKGERPLVLSVSVDKSYVLGPGDELYVYVIGQIPGVDLSQIPQRLVVDREGKIYIPGFGVFYVWGMTVSEAEKLISKTLKLNIKLTVGRVRTFPVYVSGEVNRPGAVVVTALHTVIDALIMAGGVKKTGSLRHIVLTRKEGSELKRITIDLYDLLLKGKPVDIRLRDGDVIFVSPIKNVVGIAGGVRRPAIYELKGGETLKDLIDMAGGILPSGYKFEIKYLMKLKNENLKI